MKLMRPNPSILQPYIAEAKTAREVFDVLQGICMDRPVLNRSETRDQIMTFWSEPGPVQKPVFSPSQAPFILNYLRSNRDDMILALKDAGVARGIGTRWQLCARILTDVHTAFVTQKAMDPFSNLPLVSSIPDGLRAPVSYRKAAEAFSAFLATREPQGNVARNAVANWVPGTATGLVAAVSTICQVADLVPAKDRAAFAEEVQDVDLESRLIDVEAPGLFSTLCWIVARNPVPMSPADLAMVEALEPFLAEDEPTMSACRAMTTWTRTRGKASCTLCGYPIFDTSRVTQETGWQVGDVLGGGWQPGTPHNTTAEVPVCLCCRAEKIVAERGVRKFGRHPIHLFNLGSEPIPGPIVAKAYADTHHTGDNTEATKTTRSAVAPGESTEFGDMADGTRGDVRDVPSIQHLRHRLTYAYFSLLNQGYRVAFEVPHTVLPRGIFGYVPPEAGEEASPEKIEAATRAAWFRRRVADLANVGLTPGSDAKTAAARNLALERVILSSAPNVLLGRFLSAVCKAHSLHNPASPYPKPLYTHVVDILSTTSDGDCPMTFENINLREEAIAWAEATHPYLLSRRNFGRKGGDTKVFYEVMDAMRRVGGGPDARADVGCTALLRGVKVTTTSGNRSFLKAEAQERQQAILDGLYERITRYSKLPAHQIRKLANYLAPMISMAVRSGVRLSPDLPQNNFVIRLDRRMNDAPEQVSTVA